MADLLIHGGAVVTAGGSRRADAAVGIGLFAVIGLLAGCAYFGDAAPTAVVAGQSYGISVVRGLAVSESDLTPYGSLDGATDMTFFLDDQTFAVRHVEPRIFLVVRAKPGLSDDAGTLGDFIGLLGPGEDQDLCRYFTRLAPTWCE